MPAKSSLAHLFETDRGGGLNYKVKFIKLDFGWKADMLKYD